MAPAPVPRQRDASQEPDERAAEDAGRSQYLDTPAAADAVVGPGITALDAAAMVDSGEATGSGLLPAPWLDRDVGQMKLKGSASYANGVFTIKSMGQEFWHDQDFYHFVYQPLKGNGEIVARIVSVAAGDDTYEDAGVLFSYDPTFTWVNNNSTKLAPGAKMMYVTAQGAVWGERLKSVGQGNWWGPGPDVVADSAKPPVWVKIIREGTKFTGFYSRDGVTWTMATNNAGRISQATIAEVPETIWVGFFFCPPYRQPCDRGEDRQRQGHAAVQLTRPPLPTASPGPGRRNAVGSPMSRLPFCGHLVGQAPSASGCAGNAK